MSDTQNKEQDYFEEVKEEAEPTKKSSVATLFLTVLDLAKTVFMIFALAIIIRIFIIQPFIVEGQSMEPNFKNNDYLITEKISYRLRSPKRGEVVIFHPPDNPSINYLKRIIGVPGDKIEIKDGNVFVNDKKISEPYLKEGDRTVLPAQDSEKITLKDKEYFVFGDNRNHSRDSRELGPIPYDSIVSRIWLRLFPFESINAFAAVEYKVEN